MLLYITRLIIHDALAASTWLALQMALIRRATSAVRSKQNDATQYYSVCIACYTFVAVIMILLMHMFVVPHFFLWLLRFAALQQEGLQSEKRAAYTARKAAK